MKVSRRNNTRTIRYSLNDSHNLQIPVNAHELMCVCACLQRMAAAGSEACNHHDSGSSSANSLIDVTCQRQRRSFFVHPTRDAISCN